MDYNIRDCELVEMLENKLGMLKQIYTMAYLAKVNFTDTFRTVKPWDALIHNHLMNKGIVSPPGIDAPNEEYEGGFCKDRPPGD